MYILMRILSLIAVVLFVSSLAASARAGMVEDCNQERDRELRISGCTVVIGSGQWQGKELAWAYNNRGLAYAYLGNPARAIEDYDQALRLDPGLVVAYLGRGVVYNALGLYRRAIKDYDEALRIDPGSTLAYNNRAIALDNLNRSGETNTQPGSPSTPQESDAGA